MAAATKSSTSQRSISAGNWAEVVIRSESYRRPRPCYRARSSPQPDQRNQSSRSQADEKQQSLQTRLLIRQAVSVNPFHVFFAGGENKYAPRRNLHRS